MSETILENNTLTLKLNCGKASIKIIKELHEIFRSFIGEIKFFVLNIECLEEIDSNIYMEIFNIALLCSINKIHFTVIDNLNTMKCDHCFLVQHENNLRCDICFAKLIDIIDDLNKCIT
ncbi:MAG: hypothetical protein H6610_08690 [Ignavibacteriales bacterium]|nr:hypothetical protein [Ignavibacteriales bacterium]MCB9257878.1 hypothetical protein [Ignavibacteriales bacterium]